MDDESKLVNELNERATESAGSVDTSRTGQLSSGAGALAASGSIGYYLAENTDFFRDAFTTSELPAYAALAAVSFLAIKELVSICGRIAPKTVLAGVATGGATGLSIGLGVAGLAFGALADVALCGGLMTTGAVVGWLFTKSGKKKHRCGAKLPCDRWICPNCRRLITPSKEWTTKDRWNILDVCDYLDTGGLEWHTMKAIAFLEYCKLIDAAQKYTGSRALWNPKDIRDSAANENLVRDFSIKWDQFVSATPLPKEGDTPKTLNKFYQLWHEFKNRNR